MLFKIIWGVGAVAVTLIIYGVQKHLSTRRAWQLGAVVPLLSIVAMISLYFVMQVSLSVNYIVAGTILLALELIIWIDGRYQYRKEELLKMKVKDIN